MKKIGLILLAMMSVNAASAAECTVSLKLGVLAEVHEKGIQELATRELEEKGYTVVESAGTYELLIGSIQYCYGKKGPPSWAFERGYGVEFTKGPHDYNDRSNLIMEKEIDSMVLFGNDIATRKLKRVIRHLPTCAEVSAP